MLSLCPHATHAIAMLPRHAYMATRHEENPLRPGNDVTLLRQSRHIHETCVANKQASSAAQRSKLTQPTTCRGNVEPSVTTSDTPFQSARMWQLATASGLHCALRQEADRKKHERLIYAEPPNGRRT